MVSEGTNNKLSWGTTLHSRLPLVDSFGATQKDRPTRMHSSRMRTARLLPVSPGMHCSRGDVPGPGEVPGPGGCTWSQGGTWSGGGGVPGPGGCTWSRGGGYLPKYSPLWTGFLTHTCENITLPQTSFTGSKNRNSMDKATSPKYSRNKNAFQWDAYRPLVDHMLKGGGGSPCLVQGGFSLPCPGGCQVRGGEPGPGGCARSQGGLPGPGGVLPAWSSGGGVLPALSGGVYQVRGGGGVPGLGGVPGPRGVVCQVPGVCAWSGGWYPSMHWGRPPVNRMNDRHL